MGSDSGGSMRRRRAQLQASGRESGHGEGSKGDLVLYSGVVGDFKQTEKCISNVGERRFGPSSNGRRHAPAPFARAPARYFGGRVSVP